MRRLVLVSTIAAAACAAPVADLRPPSAMVHDDRTFEVGAGAVTVRPRQYVIEDSHEEAQLWFTGRATPWLSLSGLGAFDGHSGVGGIAALARYVTTDRFIAGIGAEGGYAWVGGSLSGAVRLFDDTWIYTAPRVSNWGIFVAPAVPVGFTSRIYDGFSFRAEAQLSWQDAKYFNRRLHLAGGAAYEW
jgi:hypothetical protein